MTDPLAPLVKLPEPWNPTRATERLRAIAKSEYFNVSFKRHALEQLAIRDLTTSDALYVVKNGFVHRPAIAATQLGLFRYCIECTTPNSSRGVRVVIIPSMNACEAKIVTVMWVDEPLVGG